ncbi:MAG: TonB-dependent receptor [Gammaproteobacteria bacterium]|nr:TonB-dependent receptor [Gammaproteobacteria bacterium]
MNKTLLATIISSLLISQIAVAAQEKETTKKSTEKYLERIQIVGHDNNLRTDTGSATLIDAAELEKFEYDDINRILANVPGVNIRQEDGYGLRPNIGFRGSTPERSKKIALMEDGILIAPAPYSASAAYYFPMVSRMTGVEVFKGPSSIKYGPNTVAGALNFITRQIPEVAEGGLDLGVGGDGYNKAHLYYGTTNGNFGYLIEGIHTEADGFKELDNGANTGFKKNSFMTKLRYNLSTEQYGQFVELKLGYDDEISNESYIGLSDDDFEKTPFRRYAASQEDLMDWDHQSILLTHHFEAKSYSITTRAYRNNFARSWFKLNGFSGASVEDVIAQPYKGLNPDFMAVLRGERDSSNSTENLIIGDNAREYYSQGLQSDLAWDFTLGGLAHNFEAGLRYHRDQIERFHTTDVFVMRSGDLERISTETHETTFNTETTDAWSVYLQDSIHLGALKLTVGVRGEFIDAEYQNTLSDQQDDWLTKSSQIWLPGFSAFYQSTENLGFLFGVNKGYVPTSPKQKPAIKAEESVNYELGARYSNGNTKAEMIGFFNDMSNLKESCTFSAGAKCTENVDEEFNGGAVDVYGLEASLSHTFSPTDSIDFPVSLVYTHTKSEFKETFDSKFALWGNITAGDEVPYLPDNQLTLIVGFSANRWQASILTSYVGEMKEISGTGDKFNFVGVKTKALTTVDFSATYDLGDDGSFYLKADNILNRIEIVSHRPYGARPSKPRQLFLGYKYSF